MIISLIVLLIALWFAFKIPAVQNYIADLAASYLSAQLGTKVTVGRVDIELFNKAILEDVYIEDLHHDTLLYAQQVKAYINIFSIWNKQLNVQKVEVSNGVFNYRRPENEEDFNLFFLIRFFEGAPSKGPRKPPSFILGISEARARNFRFNFYDASAGTDLRIYAPHAYVSAKESDSTNLVRKFVRADSVFLDSALVQIRKFKSVPLPSQLDDDTTNNKNNPQDTIMPRWNIAATKVRIQNTTFRMRNELQRVDPERDLDFADLNVQHIYTALDNFSLYQENIRADFKHLSAKEKRGFVLSNLRGKVFVNPKHVAITNFELKTPYSTVGDSIFFDYDHYSGFLDFVNKVEMRGYLENSTIAIRDIVAFAHTLKKNPFFQANYNRQVRLHGHLFGTINNLDAPLISIQMGNGTSLEATMKLDSITVPDKGYMDLAFNNLYTNYSDMKAMLPFVALPNQMATLGNMRFIGHFKGYFKDFLVDGAVATQIGSAQLDSVKMNLTKGNELATYSGWMACADFDLGKFLSREDLGLVTLHSGFRGAGLTANSLDIHFDQANIDTFQFKKYTYEDIKIEKGQLRNRRFDGQVLSNDPNFSFAFDGKVDLRDSLLRLDFLGKINHIDFQQINLTPEQADLQIDSFRMHTTGSSLSDLIGHVFLGKVTASRFGNALVADSIHLSSEDSVRFTNRRGDTLPMPDTIHLLKLQSDLLQMRISGHYDMGNLPKALARFTKKNYPNLFSNLQKLPALNITNLAKVDSLNPAIDQSFRMRVSSVGDKNVLSLIDSAFQKMDSVEIQAYFDSKEDSLRLNSDVKMFQMSNVRFNQVAIRGNGKNSNFSINNKFESLYIGDSTKLPSFELDLEAKGDTVWFNTGIREIGKVASDINLSGRISFMSKMLELNLDTANLTILGHPWKIQGDNHIRLGGNKLDVYHITLTNENQSIQLGSVGTKGLNLCVNRMRLGWLYDLIKIPQINMDGSFNATVTISDVFKQKGLMAHFDFDSLLINNDHWGRSELSAKADSIQAPIWAQFTHHSDFVDSLWIAGYYYPFFATKDAKKSNTLDFEFELLKARTYVLQYFLAGALSETEGYANIRRGRLHGQLPKPSLEGMAYIHNMATTVNFLKTRYFIDFAKINMTDHGFYFLPEVQYDSSNMPVPTTGIVVRDQENGYARLGGAIRHNHFQNMRLDLNFHLNNTLAINTTKADNSTFYGKVYADGTVSFTGLFNQLKISVKATTRNNSLFVLPLDDPQEVEEVNFVRFVDKKKINIDTTIQTKLSSSGISVDIDANITPDAVAKLVFDEQTGEEMIGQGKGNLRMTYSPTGEFTMTGAYEIVAGKYAFKYQNIVNKDFIIKPGGTIIWRRGDPYEADLDLQATYQQKASLTNLLGDYTIDDNSKKLATKPSTVELLMNVKGLLSSPDITFDISVPNPEPQLKSSVDLALNAVRNNKTELNRQAFALILLQQFLPLENNSGRGGNVDLVSSGVNTLTELVGSQLSKQLTDLLGQVVTENSGISNLEIDINLRMRDQNNNTTTSANNSSLNVGFGGGLLNNRLQIKIGANVDFGNGTSLGSTSNSQSYIAGDFLAEYRLTEEGRFKIRVYYRTETTILGPTQRPGMGLTWRSEFDSWDELGKEIKKGFSRIFRKRKAIKETDKTIEEIQETPTSG